MNLWFLIAGVGSLLFAIYQFLRTKMLVDRGLSTTGTVIEQKSWGGPGNKLFIHVVRYQAGDGTDVEFKNYSLFPHKVNEAVHIRYDPRNPKRAKIDSWGKLWGFSLIYGLVGILFIVVGLQLW